MGLSPHCYAESIAVLRAYETPAPCQLSRPGTDTAQSSWTLQQKSSLFIIFLYTFCSPPIRHGGAWGERRYSSYSFSTSALDGGGWSASRLGRAFTPGERTPGTHCTGGWVSLRAGMDTEVTGKTLCPHRRSSPDRPVVQPVVRHYTAWANPVPLFHHYDFKYVISRLNARNYSVPISIVILFHGWWF
jgi:hypothetical protein